MIWLLGGYMWLFIHRPFEVWPWLGAMHVERAYMIVTIAYWALFAEKTWISNRLNVAFLCLATAILLSAFLSPVELGNNLTVEDWLKIAVFYVLVMSSVRTEEDLRHLVVAFLVIMGLYMGHSLREFLCGRSIYRMGIARMVGVDASFNDPNTFAATVVYGLPMVYPAWVLVRRRWQALLIVGYVGLSATCILLTGSRTGFTGLLVLSCVAVWASKYRVRIAVLACIAAPIIWGSLREDLRDRYLTLVDPSVGPANAEVSAESRQQMFFEGIELWKRYPLTGIGPGCGPRFSSSGLQLHNLYGQTLAETGTLGAISLLMVIAGLVCNGVEMRRMTRDGNAEGAFLQRVSTAVLVTLGLLLLLGWGGHNLFRYTWLWFGAFQASALHLAARQRVRLNDADAETTNNFVELATGAGNSARFFGSLP